HRGRGQAGGVPLRRQPLRQLLMAEDPGHPFEADASFDGGDLDCGNGLLLLIRQHIDPLEPGQLLEFRSTEISVEEDFPAWCRMTGNELVSTMRRGRQRSFLVCKGPLSARRATARAARTPLPVTRVVAEVRFPATLPPPAPAPAIPPLAVRGIGSWPRPRWMLQAIHDHIEGRLSEEDFPSTAEDATRLAVAAQARAEVDVLTDGEQRRDNYASFVGAPLHNCPPIPPTHPPPPLDPPVKIQGGEQWPHRAASLVRHPAPL